MKEHAIIGIIGDQFGTLTFRPLQYEDIIIETGEPDAPHFTLINKRTKEIYRQPNITVRPVPGLLQKGEILVDVLPLDTPEARAVMQREFGVGWPVSDRNPCWANAATRWFQSQEGKKHE